MKAKRVLFITQEITPYVPETELSILGRKLPQLTQEKGREIRTFMPKWGVINERRNQLHEVIRLSGMNIIIDDTDHPLIIKVASIQAARMQVYFIDNDDYFMRRKMELDEDGTEYEDNAERATFYARGVLETVKKLRWIPDVIHCQGWMTSIIPLYLKTAYADEPSFRDCRVVYTPSGQNLQANIPDNFANILSYKNLDASTIDGLQGANTMQALNQLGVQYSDGVALMAEDTISQQLAADGNKPCILAPTPEEWSSIYPDFFDRVWSEGKEEE